MGGGKNGKETLKNAHSNGDGSHVLASVRGEHGFYTTNGHDVTRCIAIAFQAKRTSVVWMMRDIGNWQLWATWAMFPKVLSSSLNALSILPTLWAHEENELFRGSISSRIKQSRTDWIRVSNPLSSESLAPF